VKLKEIVFVIISCQGNKRFKVIVIMVLFCIKERVIFVIVMVKHNRRQNEVSIIIYNTGRISFVSLPVISIVNLKCFIDNMKNKKYQTVEFDLFHWR